MLLLEHLYHKPLIDPDELYEELHGVQRDGRAVCM